MSQHQGTLRLEEDAPAQVEDEVAQGETQDMNLERCIGWAWVGKRPWAINEANISGEAYGEDSMGEGDQPAAPLITSVLIQVAERNIEREPATQAAQHLQTQS